MIKGIKKRPHQWYFLITQEDLYGEYDPELYRLDHFCSEKHCYIHHRLCSVNYQGEIIYEELILGDFLRAEEYLRENSSREPSTGCILWTGALNKDGYGKACFLHKDLKAHRLSWQIYHGRTLSPKEHILHDPYKCFHRNCIEVLHLRPGTNTDNTNDKKITGTLIGKFESQREIVKKKLIEEWPKKTQQQIADETGTSRNFVSRMKNSMNLEAGTKRKRKILSHETVRSIRQDYGVLSKKDLEKKYEVDIKKIRNVVNNRTFKKVKTNIEDQKMADLEETKIRIKSKIFLTKKGCWEYQGAMSHDYGNMSYKGKMIGFHILSWMVFKNSGNPVPEGKEVRHLCPEKSNPSCGNPQHLDIGTHSQNMLDKVQHGTLLSGEHHPCTKYSSNIRNKICQELKEKSLKDVAEEYKDKGLTYQQIYYLKIQNDKQKTLVDL